MPVGCEMLMIQHFLGIRLTDGSKVASFTYRPRSTPTKHNFLLLILISVRA
jgi:hypothetical protein